MAYQPMNTLLNNNPFSSPPETPRHKVFVSYHHANDQAYKNYFTALMSTITKGIVSKSVEDGDIGSLETTDNIRRTIRDKFLKDSTVTVVLVGTETWKRKHVDWEISSSLRATLLSPRSGLLGLILPSHPSFGKSTYDGGVVPPRLVDNQESGYAEIHHWANDANWIKNIIHRAYEKRLTHTPKNSYPNYVNNKFGLRLTR